MVLALQVQNGSLSRELRCLAPGERGRLANRPWTFLCAFVPWGPKRAVSFQGSKRWAWRRATIAARTTPTAGGAGFFAASLPVDTAARAEVEPTLLSPAAVTGPCPVRKFQRCSRLAAKNASCAWGGQEMRPMRALAAPSSNAFRAASEIFSSALAREIQRAGSDSLALAR